MDRWITRVISTIIGRKWGKIGPWHVLSENDDLSFLLFFWKQCLVENIWGSFKKNTSATLFLRNHLKNRGLLFMIGWSRLPTNGDIRSVGLVINTLTLFCKRYLYNICKGFSLPPVTVLYLDETLDMPPASLIKTWKTTRSHNPTSQSTL